MDDCWFDDFEHQALQEAWAEPAVIVSQAVTKTTAVVGGTAFFFAAIESIVAECLRWLSPPAHAPPAMVM